MEERAGGGAGCGWGGRERSGLGEEELGRRREVDAWCAKEPFYYSFGLIERTKNWPASKRKIRPGAGRRPLGTALQSSAELYIPPPPYRALEHYRRNSPYRDSSPYHSIELYSALKGRNPNLRQFLRLVLVHPSSSN